MDTSQLCTINFPLNELNTSNLLNIMFNLLYTIE